MTGYGSISKVFWNTISDHFYGARMLWYCRNLVAHDQDTMSPILAAKITRARVDSYLKPDFKFYIFEDEALMIWQVPEGSSIKINCDCSWLPESKVSGHGCIAINYDRVVLGVRSSFQNCVKSSFEAEGLPLLHGLRWGVSENWDSCIFETDSVDVFQIVNKGYGSGFCNIGCIKECTDILAAHET